MGSTKKPMSPTEALEMAELLEKLKGIDLNKVETPAAVDTPVDQMIRNLKNNKTVTRALKGKGRYKANLHWKTKAHKNRKYYAEVGAPRRRARLAELLTTPEGWYEYVVANWKRHRIPYRLTLEEFLEHVYPGMCRNTDGTFAERARNVPVFRRYNTRKPMALNNMIVRDMDTGEVLFDSTEYVMKKLGYAL